MRVKIQVLRRMTIWINKSTIQKRRMIVGMKGTMTRMKKK